MENKEFYRTGIVVMANGIENEKYLDSIYWFIRTLYKKEKALFSTDQSTEQGTQIITTTL